MKIKKVKKYKDDFLVFRKWGRKKYSLFRTVNKVVVIAVLAISYFTSVPVFTFAERIDTTDVQIQYNLEEIEVSAQRSPALYSQIARIISVIERNEIEAAPVQSVQELLEYIAGVDIRQRGAEGVQADVSVRGGTFDQTLILLNGINITDPQTGHHNLNLPVSFDQIERIEILEGPAARVYGPNAFSGAINIITRLPESDLIQMQISGGSFGYFNGNIFGSVSTGIFNQSFSVGRKSSKGYIDNTDFGSTEVFYSNSLRTEKGSLFFQMGLSDKGFGANSFYTPKYPNQYEEVQALLSSVKWESNSKLHFTPVIYWRNHRDRFELFRDNPPEWYKTHNYHLTNTYGINLNFWLQWWAGKTAFGVEFRSENILSNVLGEELESPKKVPGENAEFTKGDSRNTCSAFLEQTCYINNWTFSAGILGNYISGVNLGFKIFPGIDISYSFNSFFKAYSSFNTSLRLPTFTDLYYSGPTNIGNPDLKPEKSSTLEGGLKYNSDIFRIQLTVFYSEGKDIIDWVKKDFEDLWQPQNLTQLKTFGTEFQGHIFLRRKYGRYLPNQISFNYFYNNLQKETSDFISNYVLDNLKQKLIFSINQNIVKKVSLDIKIRCQERSGTYTKFEQGNWIGESAYEPFWLFDSKVNYDYNKLKFFLSVNNIFNQEYTDIGNVSQPGRWIKTGISWQIDFE